MFTEHYNIYGICVRTYTYKRRNIYTQAYKYIFNDLLT